MYVRACVRMRARPGLMLGNIVKTWVLCGGMINDVSNCFPAGREVVFMRLAS